MPLFAAFLLFAALGHALFWIGLVNRLHGFGWPRAPVKLASLAMLAWTGLGWMLWYIPLTDVFKEMSFAEYRTASPFFADYTIVMSAIGAWGILVWTRRKFFGDREAYPHPTTVVTYDVETALGRPLAATPLAHRLRRIPRNQTWSLAVETHELTLPGLPNVLHGVTVAHLTDLHLTGHVSREYFEFVIDRCNAANPDLVCITGDIIDAAECVTWLPETLGRLKAKYGCFYILGNHDQRCGDLPRLHRALAECGIQDVGGAWRILKIRGHDIIVAGVECPWFGPSADFRYLPDSLVNERPFRLLLSHSPDRFAGAVAWDFDLMLAGHTHGGQFAPPLIGPVLAPSLHGVRFSGGTFRRGKTTMHVSRGVSAEIPWRWNALPELSIFRLLVERAAEPVTNEAQPGELIDPACTLAEAL
ncbi:MAG: metallophosphoesterase [Pirellulales bacterium]